MLPQEEEEAKNFMTAKLFTPPLDDKKQKHPEKHDLLEGEDQLIIGGRQRNMKMSELS